MTNLAAGRYYDFRINIYIANWPTQQSGLITMSKSYNSIAHILTIFQAITLGAMKSMSSASITMNARLLLV